MRWILNIVLLLEFLGCSDTPSQESIDRAQKVTDSLNNTCYVDSAQKQLIQIPESNPQNWNLEVWLCDTVTAKGNFIKHLTDTAGNIFVVWGTTEGPVDTMPSDFAWNTNNCLTITGENKQYIALTSYGKGLPHLWLLPRNKSDTIQFYSGVVEFSLVYNLVLTDQQQGFILQNFITHQKNSFVLEGIERITYSIPMFNEIVFEKNRVILKWNDPEENIQTTHIEL